MSSAVAATARLLERIERLQTPAEVVRCLTGLDPRGARFLVARALLLSSEAEQVLEHAPKLIRNAPHIQTTVANRTIGEIRGTVLWNETVVARAAAGFPPDLFVCATPERDFNVPENQLLLGALRALVGAASHLRAFPSNMFDDEALGLARSRGAAARDLVGHDVFVGVAPVLSAKVVDKTRRSHRSGSLKEVRALIERTKAVDEESVMSVVDRRTARQHEIVMSLVDAIEDQESNERDGVRFECDDGELRSDLLVYRHPGQRGAVGAHGIRTSGLLVDVADVDGLRTDWAKRLLGQRSGLLQPRLIESESNVGTVVDEILRTAPVESAVPVAG